MSLPMGLLGLLNYLPMSGYDLKKMFDDSIHFFWAAQTSQIYRELKKLENNGDIGSEMEASSKGPYRKVYSITDQGRETLTNWLTSPPDQIKEDVRNELNLRILFSSELGFTKPIEQLKQQLALYEQELADLSEVEEKLQHYLQLTGRNDCGPYWRVALSKGKYITEANVKWAKDSIEYLRDISKKV